MLTCSTKIVSELCITYFKLARVIASGRHLVWNVSVFVSRVSILQCLSLPGQVETHELDPHPFRELQMACVCVQVIILPPHTQAVVSTLPSMITPAAPVARCCNDPPRSNQNSRHSLSHIWGWRSFLSTFASFNWISSVSASTFYLSLPVSLLSFLLSSYINNCECASYICPLFY